VTNYPDGTHTSLAEETQTVRKVADIVKIIGQYLLLKKRGAEYVGLCPFHEEKTASLCVNADKGVYLCRGCGAGGDVFTFIRRIEHVTFAEAKAIVAELSGVALTSGELSLDDRRVFAQQRYEEEQRGRRAQAASAQARQVRDHYLTIYRNALRFILDHDMEECQKRGDLRFGLAMMGVEVAEKKIEQAQSRMDELAKVARLAPPVVDDPAVATTVEIIRMLEISQRRAS